jgi:phage FluMu protein Com
MAKVHRSTKRKVVYRYVSTHDRAKDKECTRTVTRATKAAKIEAYCPGCNRTDSFKYDTELTMLVPA